MESRILDVHNIDVRLSCPLCVLFTPSNTKGVAIELFGSPLLFLYH